MIYLTSFPRSGCTILAFLIEAATGRPIVTGTNAPWSVSNESGVGLPVPEPFSEPALSMSHVPDQWIGCDDGQAAHTLLHRHPLEACVSFWLGQFEVPLEAGLARLNNGEVPAELRAFVQEHQQGIHYHRIWKGPKYWVEYDDVVRDPFMVLNYLGPSIGLDRERLGDLQIHRETYLADLLAWKKTRPLPVWTEGKNLTFFRDRLNPAAHKAIFTQ